MSSIGRSSGLRPVGIARTHGSNASFLRSTSGYHRYYGGPRLGVPGYGSCFTRYSPYAYRRGFCYSPAYYRYPYYGHGGYYHHYGHGYGFGFGFYSGCYAYPSYPLVYYPTYYAPLYPSYAYEPTFFPTYATAVAYPQPVVVESPTYVVAPQYATAEAAYAATDSVAAPEVSYGDESTAGYAPPAESSGPVIENNAQAYTSQEQYANDSAVAAPAPSYSSQGYSAQAQPQAPAEVQSEMPTQPPAPLDEPAQQSVQPPAEPLLPPRGNVSGTPQGQVVMPERQAPPTADESAAAPAPADAQAQAPADAQQPPAGPDEAPQPSLPVEKLQQMMVDGTKAFSEGKYVDAAAQFEKVTQADPQNVDAALATSVACFATGEYTKAAESIRQGVSLFPPIVDTSFDLRERYTKTADFIGQSRRLEQYVEKNPKNTDAMLVLGFVRHFSRQRDLAKQTFDQVAKLAPADKELAEVFLNAAPPEAMPEGAPGAGPAASAPAGPGVPPPSRPAASTTQPGGLANPGVLSVTTRPADFALPPAQQKLEKPAEPVFNGKLGLVGDTLPREQTAVDGILIRLKGTDDDPPQAYMEILIGERRMKVKRFVPGARVDLKGTSGQAYKLFLTEVDNKTESVGYVISK